ncbi:maleylpyruvate isomerase family mycothiol-dependent enzyme, partial [Streptomyces sp. NPDC056436]|uniref:maleylpyruvate isomerase family mycothiol-dependent enzyme n=1 Tax=Streptomyces sp. NPDC056436 TaxID=3345815 RepID=UPI003684D26C
MVHAERAALIGDLTHLEDEQWREPSLCDGWTVHDVLAHLVDNARATRLGFLTGMVLARFDFDRQNTRGVERERGTTPQETLERFRRVGPRPSGPPPPPAPPPGEGIGARAGSPRPPGPPPEAAPA